MRSPDANCGELRLNAESVFAALLLVLVAALLLGNALGQPVLLGFVETDSMSPALEAGDGFVAIPSFLTGGPSVGDVVVFESDETEGGGLTTHRIVGSGDEGYLTKGDANPFTDQDGGEPYVTEDRIVAEALQVGGGVVVIPELGTAVETVRWSVTALLSAVGVGSASSNLSGLVLLVAGLGLLVLAFLDERRTPSRSRARSTSSATTDPRLVLALFLAVVLLPANAAMVGPADVHEVGSSVESPSETDGTVEAEVTARNDGLVSMLVVVESADGGATVSSSALELGSGESETVTVTPVADSEAPYRISENRYFLLLPSSVLLALHSAGPIYALAAVNLLLLIGVVGLFAGLVGTGRVRSRDKNRGVPLSVRIRRRL